MQALQGAGCAASRQPRTPSLSSRGSGVCRSNAAALLRRGSAAPRRAAAASPRAERKPEVFPAEWATKPVITLREEVQGRVERSPAPLWSTFAGAAGGCWSGCVIAASPFTGAVEALALDAANKPTVLDAWTRRVSSRVSVGGEGALHETLWWRLAEGDAAASPAGIPPAGFERLASTAFADQREGFAFWEDGSFSDGPLSLRQAAARASLANPGCVEIEQCVCVGGRRRARVTHTIALRKAAEVAAEQWGLSAQELAEMGDDGEDLLLQQLRVRAVIETWDGPPPAVQSDDDTPPPASYAATPPLPLSTQPRPVPRSAGGEWLAFVRAAAPVAAETDPLPPAATLPGAPPPPPPARFAHEAYEQTCTCAVPSGRPYPPPGYDEDEDVDFDVVDDEGNEGDDEASDDSPDDESDDNGGDIVVRGIPRADGGDGRDSGDEGDGEDVGSAVWLPGGVVATCALGTGPGGDGVTLRAGWAQPRGGMVFVEREYDGDGRLVEVRHVTQGRPGADGRTGGGA